jgi:ATP-dependent Clp protease ATP-binding subunit ClpC
VIRPRLRDDAQRAVVLAQREALALGHPYIGAEHMLLGLSAAYGSAAARALESLGITPGSVCMEIVAAIGQGPTHTAGGTGFAPRAERALKLSLREALSLRSRHIGSEHLLLGLLRDSDSPAGYVPPRRRSSRIPPVQAIALTDFFGGSQAALRPAA